MNKILTLLFSLLFMKAVAQEGTLVFTISDAGNDPCVAASVELLQNDSTVYQTYCNEDGLAIIPDLFPGNYQVFYSYIGTSDTVTVNVNEGLNRKEVTIGYIDLESMVLVIASEYKMEEDRCCICRLHDRYGNVSSAGNRWNYSLGGMHFMDDRPSTFNTLVNKAPYD
ncbi:MAG: carboxypeptidase regulatory-like domain-containing protein [Bacteroidetes bacterium]|nr:carboxypeptidase regulatory-like domain-containing protein [Bacteroidota bacterium]